jgi:hypothetical protein
MSPLWNCDACGKFYIHGKGHKCPVRGGSVRYKRDGQWIITNPGDPLYSAALFSAEEAYTDNGWEPIEGPTITEDDVKEISRGMQAP